LFPSTKPHCFNFLSSAQVIIAEMRRQIFRVAPAFLLLIPMGLTVIGWSLLAILTDDLEKHPKLFVGSVGLLWANLTVSYVFSIKNC
jgi:hypothetical protein